MGKRTKEKNKTKKKKPNQEESEAQEREAGKKKGTLEKKEKQRAKLGCENEAAQSQVEPDLNWAEQVRSSRLGPIQ